MKKEEIIRLYGIESYEKQLAQGRAYNKAHREEEKARVKKYRETYPEESKAAVKRYREENPEKIIADSQEAGRKGGRRYDKHLEYKRTGLQGA